MYMHSFALTMLILFSGQVDPRDGKGAGTVQTDEPWAMDHKHGEYWNQMM
jgi:hypothetical protein